MGSNLLKKDDCLVIWSRALETGSECDVLLQLGTKKYLLTDVKSLLEVSADVMLCFDAKKCAETICHCKRSYYDRHTPIHTHPSMTHPLPSLE